MNKDVRTAVLILNSKFSCPFASWGGTLKDAGSDGVLLCYPCRRALNILLKYCVLE